MICVRRASSVVESTKWADSKWSAMSSGGSVGSGPGSRCFLILREMSREDMMKASGFATSMTSWTSASDGRPSGRIARDAFVRMRAWWRVRVGPTGWTNSGSHPGEVAPKEMCSTKRSAAGAEDCAAAKTMVASVTTTRMLFVIPAMMEPSQPSSSASGGRDASFPDIPPSGWPETEDVPACEGVAEESAGSSCPVPAGEKRRVGEESVTVTGSEVRDVQGT